MKDIFSFLLSGLLLFVTQAQNTKPKLVIGIVVDQMRTDYLYRFSDDFSGGGFKRLLNEGVFYSNMHYNYIPTYTAPGHASIYTGTTPAIHGIVGNGWFHAKEGKRVYCTSDDTQTTVGDDSSPKAGKMSPHRLEATTITDEVKLMNPNALVMGISIKDRGAILPAGHFADQAFWMNDMGNFISSSFYKKDLPKWVKKYNKKDFTSKYLKQGWDLLKNKKVYEKSIADNNPYERIFDTKKTPTFPYDLETISKEMGRDIIKTTPHGNTMVREMASLAIEEEKFGEDDVTDFLAISFSSTDYVGHSFGPRSVEIQDTYLRLDLELEKLFKQLDSKVGKENYLVFLTADHAAADNADFLKDKGYKIDDLNGGKIAKSLKDFTQERFGTNLLLDYYNQNVFLDHKQIEAKGLKLEHVKNAVMDFLYKTDHVKRVYTSQEILRASASDYQLNLVRRGYDMQQNGDLFVLHKPGYMESYGTGTTHGTGYAYDTHVPFIIMGSDLPKNKTVTKKHLITEVAPTLSVLLQVAFPNGSENTLLNEIFE